MNRILNLEFPFRNIWIMATKHSYMRQKKGRLLHFKKMTLYVSEILTPKKTHNHVLEVWTHNRLFGCRTC